MEERKEWKDDLEEFWEMHDAGAKAALQELAATGDPGPMEAALGHQAAEAKRPCTLSCEGSPWGGKEDNLGL